MRPSSLSLCVRAALGGACVALPAIGANTDIHNEPLSQAASGVKPNIMFILDDSGSMNNDYTPDFVNDDQGSGTNPTNTAFCFDSGDSGGTGNDYDDGAGLVTGRQDACQVGDPPYMSPDFNTQYYNPAIRYRPGVNADGTSKNSMNATNTTNWTSVPTDPYGQQRTNQFGSSATNVNLVTGYPDRVWCKATGDSANDPALCKTNSGYTYPNYEFPYGRDGTPGNRKYKFGGPYYYTMQTAQWCSDATLTTCASGSAVNPSVHTFIAPEFCTDSELTNCAAGAALTAAHTFKGPRFCSDRNTLLLCQRKKIGNFKWPKHLGTTSALVAPVVAAAASASFTVTSASNGQSVTGITVDGVNILSGSVLATGSTSGLATNLATAINGLVSTPDYTAVAVGSVVTITAVTQGTAENGKTVAVATTSAPTATRSVGIIQVSNGNDDVNYYVEEVRVDLPSGTVNIMATNCTASALGNNVTTEAGGLGRRLRASDGLNNNNERNSMAKGIYECINQGTATNGGYSATYDNARTITIQGPAALGCELPGSDIDLIPSSGGSAVPHSETDFNGGVPSTCAAVQTSNPGSMQNGADAVAGATPHRIGVGHFARVNIQSGQTYTKFAGRSDCAGTTCTYDEEITNFANWYSYYRRRMQMMKTAAGRAFVPIDSTYRVGFITINPEISGDVSASRYLRIQDFDATHKSNWYTKFYAQDTHDSTPLREALSRVGRLYAGKFDGINSGIPSADDPVLVSCQPNFAILSTDGYWNGNGGQRIDGTAMTNQDNADTAPYSKRSDGVYDGAPGSPTIGLADVALYYYKTDLRPTGSKNDAGVDVSADNVPTTQQDFAAHQHMTTFTLGLGLDGELSYRSDYQTATTGDFVAIKQGTINWPNPQNDNPRALDDLWHAAVNGRGVFFSASNPQELANSLSDTLDALKKRVGAGAAAATSNLQPIAGDNFAFTAQYQTQDWIGDLKARTIDLSTGAISSVELWSAQEQLQGRVHTSRILYTFDGTDAYDPAASTGPVGNGVKHFCMPGSVVAGSGWCEDGGGLTGAEQAFFNPNRLIQFSGYTAGQLVSATTLNLVNYVRGHQTYEAQSVTPVGDDEVFRGRTALLGDIINAQPSYVKRSPFGYNDRGYTEFKACTSGTTTVTCPAAQFPTPSVARRPTVYIAANDGMLHAIETDVNNNPYFQINGIATPATGDDTFSTGNNNGNGVERWAYIPGIVLPDLYYLANNPASYTHRYFVDGSPTVGDICIDAACLSNSATQDHWRTILVGGLNSGGRGFYALDITNPLAPRAMWEFKVRKPSVTTCAASTVDAEGATDDCDIGLSYGNPVITKLKETGQWVVIVTSGLNNTGIEPGGTARMGDGGGYLYILDAVSGRILKKIGTGVGSPGTNTCPGSCLAWADATPSGLSRINNWVDNSLSDNTTTQIYGGDMLGNLWRFELDPANVSLYNTAVKVAELRNGSGQAQPVTTKPELGLISNRHVILFGTGRFLGNTDKGNTNVQSIYAIADDQVSNVTLTDRSTLVQQALTTLTTVTRTVDPVQPVDWTNNAVRGWFIDLPDTGERVNVDPQLQLGTFVIASNVPSTDTCVAGGTAWINTLDFKTGGYVQGAVNNAASQRISGSVAVGINIVQLPGGKVVTIVTTADNQQLPVETPVAPTNFSGRRVGWRELTADQ